MKPGIVNILCLTVILFTACPAQNPDKYAISISRDEYVIMKRYLHAHRSLAREISLKPGSVSSDDRDVLIKIKMRLAAIDSEKYHFGPYTPIFINHDGGYYYVSFIGGTDWLNDEEIYSQAGLIPRSLGRFFESTKKLFCGVLNPHIIHTLQNQHTPLLAAGLLIILKINL